MLLDGGSSGTPKPRRKPAAAPSSTPAPAAAVQDTRDVVQEVHRLLTFAPPKFDPNAVSSARAQLEAALANPMTPARAQAEAGVRQAAARLSRGQLPVPDPVAEAGERREAAGHGRGLSAEVPFEEASSTPKAEEQLAEALRAQRREAIGAGKLDFTGNRDKVRKITEEQYSALDPRQRQAIDFNTQLVRAVRRDRQFSNSVSDAQREKYDDTVDDIFAEGRGSEHYAPETVALLKQIGFSDPNADLDDFLSLDAAIRPKDIRKMAGPEPTVADAMRPDPQDQVDSPVQDRLNLSRQLAAHTGRMQATLAQGQQLLQTMNATATSARNGLVTSFGGQASKVRTTPGFGRGPRDAYFQGAFATLANSAEDVKGVLATLNAKHPEDYQAFLDYAATRLANAERHGLELGGVPDVKYRTPEQIRKELGLEKEV